MPGCNTRVTGGCRTGPLISGSEDEAQAEARWQTLPEAHTQGRATTYAKRGKKASAKAKAAEKAAAGKPGLAVDDPEMVRQTRTLTLTLTLTLALSLTRSLSLSLPQTPTRCGRRRRATRRSPPS